MSEAVRVDLREATMTESARLRERDNQLFLVMDTPPPVRSLLRLTIGDERKAFEVARVIEVIDEAEPDRGCYGAWVDEARLSGQASVGSEHLEPGISGGSGAGVPAPVVIMNTSEMMMADAGDDDDVVLTRSERFAAPEESEPSAAGEESAASNEGEGESAASSEGEPSEEPPSK